MNRRDFFRGTLMSVAGSTALVKLASESEVKALVPQRELLVGHMPEIVAPDPRFVFGSPEIYMKLRENNREGFVCVGFLKSLTVSNNLVDITTWEGNAEYHPGLRHGVLTSREKDICDDIT